MSNSILSILRTIYFLIVLVIPGTFAVGYVLYTTIQFQIETSGFTRAHILYLEINEADSTGNTQNYVLMDAEGNETVIVDEEEEDTGDSEDAGPIFDERRVRFDPANPVKVYFENSWFGTALALWFAGTFIFVGYLLIRRVPFFDASSQLYFLYPAISILFLGVFLMADYFVSLDKENENRFAYEHVAVAIILGGMILMYKWIQGRKV